MFNSVIWPQASRSSHSIRATLSLDARVDLAAVHIALGELNTAVDILEAARLENPDHAVLLARLAWCRLQQNNRDQAPGAVPAEPEHSALYWRCTTTCCGSIGTAAA